MNRYQVPRGASKPKCAASFIAGVLLHALLLCGLRIEMPHPLAISEEPSPVAVTFIESPLEAAPPSPPAAPPEPVAALEPAEPQSTPEIPSPEPPPLQETMTAPESIPSLPRTSPRRQERRHSATLRSAAGAAAAQAGSHGAASGPQSSHASYLSNPKPNYPAEARQLRQQGVVFVSVEVGADGRPSEVTLVRSSGFRLLDEAAIEAVRRWRFEAARAAGLPVSSRVEVPVRFSLSE